MKLAKNIDYWWFKSFVILILYLTSLYHNSIFTFPLFTTVDPDYTITFESSTSFNLSPGLNAGSPLYGQVAHLNESPR